ncbi:hypothetical protein [Kiloniella majae]|uniref:hypothetical protein n=1 Tax=Kiloniella majae TaxID=1938558 RepID=UPI000F770D00|nr:hypothetical protein [Kiloniella majae]
MVGISIQLQRTIRYGAVVITTSCVLSWPLSSALSQSTETPIYQNPGYTVFTPGQVTVPGGGYARQATQAGQATQARQAEGYVSPYSPTQPYRPVLPYGPVTETPIPSYNVQSYSAPLAMPIQTGTPGMTSGVTGTVTRTETTTKTSGGVTTSTTSTNTTVYQAPVPTTTRTESVSKGTTVPYVAPSTSKLIRNNPILESPAVIQTAPQAPSVSAKVESVDTSTASTGVKTSTEASGDDSSAKAVAKEEEATEETSEEVTEEAAATSETSEEVSSGGGDVVHHEEEKEPPGMTLEQITAMRKASEERAKRNLVREDVAPITSIDTVREWSGPNLNSLISQVGDMVRTAANNSLAMIGENTLEIKVDPKDIEDAAAEEDKRQKEKEKKIQEEKERKEKLKAKLEEQQRKLKEELERQKKDKKYKARRDAEKKLEEERKELEKKNKELKRKAEKHKKDGEDLDREDKNLREIEQEMRRDGDPNCRSSACQNIRKLRAENQADKAAHRNSGTALQKEAKQFRKDVKEHQKAVQTVEDMKDRKFGMNDAEFEKHKSDKKIKNLAVQEEKIRRAMSDLRQKAEWQKHTKGITENEANDLRKQMRGLEGLLEKNEAAQAEAKEAAFTLEANALGLGEELAKAQQAFDKHQKANGHLSAPIGPNIDSDIPNEFMNSFYEAKSIKGMDVGELEKVSGQFDSALERLEAADKALASGEIPKGGSADSLAKFGQLADKLDKIQDDINQENKDKDSRYRQEIKEQHRRNQVLGDALDEVKKAQQALVEAGDTEYIDFDVSGMRSEEELREQMNKTFTGPKALREKVAANRAKLLKATAAFHEANENLQNYSEGMRSTELRNQANEVRKEMRGLLPDVEVDIFSRQVGLHNTDLANGLARGPDGKVDRKAFGNNVAVVADQQMKLAKLGSELDSVNRKLADFNAKAGLTAQQAQHTEVLAYQRDQILSQQNQVVGKLGELGVQGKMQDGKFTPEPMTRGGAITWNTARDQVVKTFKEIEENRRKVAEATNRKVSLAGLPSNPDKSGQGTVEKLLSRDQKSLSSIAGSIGGVTGAVLAGALQNEGENSTRVNLNNEADNLVSGLENPIRLQKSKEVIRLENAIAGLDDNIEAVEGSMIAARGHKLPGLETGLSAQREALFTTRAVLEVKLDRENEKLKQEILRVQTRTKKGSKETEELKQALTSLDLNIASLETVEKALIKSGQQGLSQGYTSQRQALEVSRSQVAKALERQQAVDKEKIRYNQSGLNTIDRLLGRSDPLPINENPQPTSIPVVALENEKTKELSTTLESLNKSIESIEETMSATEGSNVPGLLKSLEDQREAMFAGRDALSKQLADEKARLKKQAEKLKNQSPVEQREIARKKAKPENLETSLDENIKAFDAAAKHYREVGQENLAQVFDVQKAALEKERQRLKVTNASYTTGENITPERSELDAVKSLVSWLNKDVLPAFSKEDPALRILPSVIAEMTHKFGAETTEQILDEALDELVDHNLKPDGAVLIDVLFKRINRELVSQSKENSVNELPRLNFLSKILSTRKKGSNTNETAYLQASYDTLRERLIKSRYEGLNKPNATSLSLVEDLSALVQLASFPGTDLKELRPLIAQLERQLTRLSKSVKGIEKEKLNSILAELNTNTRKLLHTIRTTVPKGREQTNLTTALTKQLISINDLRATVYGQQFSSEQSKSQAQIRKEYAASRLEQIRNLVNSGKLSEALDVLKNLESEDAKINQSKALALIDLVTQIERRYGFLNESEKEKLGNLADLRKLREKALQEFVEQNKDPKIIAGISLHWADRLLREGNLTEAASVLSKALEKKPLDPSLLALQARVTLAKKGAEVTDEDIKSVLGNIPVTIGAEVGSIMLNGYVEQGEYAKAKTLISVLRQAEDFDETTKKRLLVQLDFAEISVLASGLGSGQDDNDLKKKIQEFQKRLMATEGLGDRYKKALMSSGNRLIQEIDKAIAWQASLDKNTTYASELGNIARSAIRSGRYDIAEDALKKQIAKLLTEHGPQEIGQGFRQITRLLDGVRMRSQDPQLTEEQRKTFAQFLKATGEAVNTKLDEYFKERIATASKTARVKEKKASHLRSLSQINLEIRTLAQLKIRLDLLSVPPEQRVKKMTELVAAATKDIDKKEAQILKAFDGLGNVLRDNETTKINLEEQITQLNGLRSLRDGMQDYYIENAGIFTPPDYRMYGMNYGSFLPENHREWQITTLQRTLAGVYANGKSADKIWEERKNLGNFTVGRGLREKTLANHKNTPRDREYKANEKKYLNHWLVMAMDDAELKYLDQRRADLINEDPERSRSERGQLYEKLITAEAKYLKALVGTSNPLLEMFEQLGQTGRLMKGAANELEGRIVLNQQRLLVEEYQAALIDEDAQRLFRAMIPLREASLAGELDSFVSYLHIEWYEAGPARAANLLGGMSDTQAELEEVIAESQKLNIALIRAGHNLPSQLSEKDKEVLRTHGFLKDGVYTIPKQIVLDPTKVGSEFVKKTTTGTAATIDRFLNAKQAGELFATIAIPGGVAGKFGRWATAEVLAAGAVRSLGGKALAYGTGLALEAGAFTFLNRTAQVALDPALLMKEGYWSSETLLKEYAHNLLIIGALKGFGAGSEGVAKAAQHIGRKQLAGILKQTAIFGEAAVLTALNGLLEGNQISQDDYLGNLLTIVLLKGTGKVLEGKNKSPLQRLNEARINRWLETIGKPPVPGTGPTTKVSQLREAQIRHIEYVDWLLFVDKPTKILMETYNGNWDAARKDYQNGNLSAHDMRKLVNLRRQIVDNLANEIVQEIGGEVQAFGSENLTSDYDISFVGPKAALGVILFNARFANRWKLASEIGGRETGLVLDTNAYTETIQSLIEAGKGDVLFQDAFAHLSARKALPKEAWDTHKKWILENTSESKRAEVAEALRLAEKYNTEYRDAIEAQKERLRNDKENPIQEVDLQITAENRLYESALKDILELRTAFEKASGAEKESLRQKLRNAQSKALYFAQEAYYTQAAIEHVVFTIQAAKRSITAESLLADTAPELKIKLTPEQGRQSYFEQIAHMLHEITHSGDPSKLASKGAKYFVRALDAAQIAGLKLGSLERIVRETVELNDNRADIDKVKEILAQEAIDARAKELNRELTDAEKEAIYNEAGQRYLSDIQQAANILTAALYNQTSGLREVASNNPRGERGELEFANDNVDPDKATAPQTNKPVKVEKVAVEAPAAEVPKAPGSEVMGSEVIKVDVSRPDLTAKAQTEFNFTDPSGAEHFLPLGKHLGSGSTSHVYQHAGNKARVVRVTVAEKWDARVLDEFGRFALEKLVDTRFIRIVQRFARFDVTKTSTEYFEVRDTQSVEINERMERGTAEQIMREQGGEMTKGQSLALDQALRELNRRGLAWLDVKPDNYSFEKLKGTDRWRVVVLDPGGIVAMHGRTARQRYDNARNVQRLINRPTAEQLEVWQDFPGAREMVLNEIRQLVRENHRGNFNFGAMKMRADAKVAFNPGGIMELAEVRRLFDLTPEASNDNYLQHYKTPPAAKAKSQP